jgi:Beta-propeller repeat
MNASRSLYSLVCLFVLSVVAHADPRINYSTYLSGSKTFCVDELNNPCGSGVDPGVPYARAVGVAVDGTGNIYVAGITNETDFPNTKGQKVPVFCETDGSACRPATSFLTKFSASGQLVYSVFLPSGQQVYGLAVDHNGNAYVTGNTNLAEGSFREFFGVVDKFTPTGTLAYQFTLIAAGCPDGQDTALTIVLNSTGTAAYVAGRSSDFGTGCAPTTLGAYETNPNFQAGLWVVKLNVSQSTAATLTYGTYVGPLGVPNDLTAIQAAGLGGIAVDGAGNAYITGWANPEVKWPTTAGAYRISAPGGYDGFVTKLNSTGTALAYSTYIGGTGADLPTGIRVDSVGNAYIAGTTTSSTFPHTQTFGSGSTISFVARLNSSGSGLLYSTLLYGDSASGIAAPTKVGISSPDILVGASNATLTIDSGGNAYAVGFTNSTGFFKAIPFQSTLRGSTDAAYTRLNQSG